MVGECEVFSIAKNKSAFFSCSNIKYILSSVGKMNY